MQGQDWDTVAKVIRDRLEELGIGQQDLVKRSGVSAATIRELTYNYKPRRRSALTLGAVSAGLGWPPDHLDSVLHGRSAEESAAAADAAAAGIGVESKAVSAQLAVVLEHLEQISADVRELKQIANEREAR
ncbi:MAG TPA: XRE family transcriptional regulator [Amycolatopsis sp.]|nr:XRE family transcriptional regulator [Amycolatopsis sp.]